MKRNISLFLLLTFLVGCATVYSGVVTLTSVVDTSMKAWAELSVKGATSPSIDTRVVAAHNQYRQAAKVAQDALIAYKANGGDPNAYVAALAAAKTAASGLVDIIVPLLTPQKATTIKANLTKATQI